MFPCGFHQEVIYFPWAANDIVGSIGGEGEDENDDKNNDGVGVVRLSDSQLASRDR